MQMNARSEDCVLTCTYLYERRHAYAHCARAAFYHESFPLTSPGTTGRVVDDSDEKMGRMLRQFQEHVHNKFNRYAFGFFGCECMNLCIAVISIFATHRFLNYQFLAYGLLVYRCVRELRC